MHQEEIVKILNSGGIGVYPTDTLYGIIGRADLPETVERIYELKDRNLSKPFIILISSLKDLDSFDISLSEKEKQILEKFWPGKVSIILKVNDERFSYLTRGTRSLAFRMPDKEELLDILKETGPLVAPSANPEGVKPAEMIDEARRYFDNKVDFYIGGENLKGEPSTLISLENSEIKVLRKGAVKIKL